MRLKIKHITILNKWNQQMMNIWIVNEINLHPEIKLIDKINTEKYINNFYGASGKMVNISSIIFTKKI